MKWFLVFIVIATDGEPRRNFMPMDSLTACVEAEKAVERYHQFTQQGAHSTIIECVVRRPQK